MKIIQWQAYKCCNVCNLMLPMDRLSPIADKCPSCHEFNWRGPIAACWTSHRSWWKPWKSKTGHWKFKDPKEAARYADFILSIRKRLETEKIKRN